MLEEIQNELLLRDHARLIAVSKTRSVEQIMHLYSKGIRDFGENRVQEFLTKRRKLPEDIQWHFIGHLQQNKVRSILPYIDMIHSVDSIRLLKTIEKEAQKLETNIRILLQIKIAEEESKYGFSMETLTAFFHSYARQEFSHIIFSGVMGMATYTEDVEQIAKEFSALKNHFELIKNEYFSDDEAFKEISIGMSNDYKIALEHGSTMIRIGSLLFNS